VDQRDSVVTPEAIALFVDTAGLGSRMIALIVDSIFQGVAVLAVFILFASVGPGTTVGWIFVIAVFAIVWGYFPAFEIFWNGRTPGKRAQRLRVVRTDGQPAGAGPILVRNIIRIADFLPGFYAVGSVAILLSGRNQRLGDLAAGTMVVRDRVAPVPAPLDVPFPGERRVDTAAITHRDYVIVRDFLQRRTSFDPTARAALARDIATALRDKVSDDYSTHDEAFLESLAASFRERFSGESS
jgi:uncharacterized RDD family membrane protein YckC